MGRAIAATRRRVLLLRLDAVFFYIVDMADDSAHQSSHYRSFSRTFLGGRCYRVRAFYSKARSLPAINIGVRPCADVRFSLCQPRYSYTRYTGTSLAFQDGASELEIVRRFSRWYV